MRTARWTWSLLLTSALLVLLTGSCTDSLTPASSNSAGSRMSGDVDASLSQTVFTEEVCGVRDLQALMPRTDPAYAAATEVARRLASRGIRVHCVGGRRGDSDGGPEDS
jgi:hypothetical protein